MQADVFTTFLTNEVKVFPAKKGIKPFKLAKRYIRKAYPFLLCSAMLFMACTDKSAKSSDKNSLAPNASTLNIPPPHTLSATTNSVDSVNLSDTTINWEQVYDEVVNKYKLNKLKDKVPFSKNEIEEMMKSPNPPSFYDYNFNHCAENEANFWEIVRNGISFINNEIQNSENLTTIQKKTYRITAFKMLSQMSKYKNSKDEIDITDYNNKKTFLFFEKVIKYRDEYGKVFLGYQNNKPFIDERNEFLGRYYKNFEEMVKMAKKYPYVKNFAKALYSNNDRFILTPADSAKANAISIQMFKEFLKEQNITDENVYELTDSIHTAMDYNYPRGTTFIATIIVNNKGQVTYDKVEPVGSLLIHEFEHALVLNPASNETPQDNRLSDKEAKKLDRDEFTADILGELGPTLNSLERADYIYKIINGIDLDVIVDYGVTIDTGFKKIPAGELAVWWRNKKEEHPSLSVDETLCHTDVMEQLNKWGNEEENVDESSQFYNNYKNMSIER